MKEEIYLLLDNAHQDYQSIVEHISNTYLSRPESISIVSNLAGTQCYTKLETDEPYENSFAYKDSGAIIDVYSRRRTSEIVKSHDILYQLSVSPEWQEEVAL